LLDGIGHHHVMMWGLIACIGVAQAVAFTVFIRRLNRRGVR
jgi:hypothetical protein